MILLLLLAASSAHTCTGGVYPGVSTSEAHGPLARLALHTMARSDGLQYLTGPGTFSGTVPFAQLRYAAPAPVVAPVPVAAPVPVTVPRVQVPVASPVLPARLAAPVDVIHHVPTVADVPVTKYIAQPGYVQKLVDVTKTKVATAKIQVRRPAIQKQFYDIEERTVVRPVGSAVVELEEPISKNLVSPFTVVPSGQHTVARYQRPLAYYPGNAYPFVSSYPFQVPVQTYPPFFIQQTQGVTQLPQRPQIPQFPQQIPQRPQIPQQPQFPQRPQIPQQPQFPQRPQIPQQPQFPEQPQVPQQPQIPQRPQPPQQLPSIPQPIGPPDNSESNEFDFSDTVVVDNPELGRSGNKEEPQLDSSSQNSENTNGEESQSENTGPSESQFETSSDKQILDEFQTRQLLRQFFAQNDLVPDQRFQLPQNLQQTQPKETTNIQRSSSSEEDMKQRSEESSETTRGPLTTESSISSFRSFIPQILQRESRVFSSEGQIASTRASSPEEAQSNQQKLIELLTGRGEISEVELSRSGVKISPVGDAGVVRGRVLSVTPAPRTSEGEERVSTRRVVVSRPVQTLEEVDVQQPFAQVERVAVHEPALLKTAHTHVARVPSSVPVLTRTLAPVYY